MPYKDVMAQAVRLRFEGASALQAWLEERETEQLAYDAHFTCSTCKLSALDVHSLPPFTQ